MLDMRLRTMLGMYYSTTLGIYPPCTPGYTYPPWVYHTPTLHTVYVRALHSLLPCV